MSISKQQQWPVLTLRVAVRAPHAADGRVGDSGQSAGASCIASLQGNDAERRGDGWNRIGQVDGVHRPGEPRRDHRRFRPAWAREVVAPGTPGLAAIAEAFGAGVIGPDGALDRAGWRVSCSQIRRPGRGWRASPIHWCAGQGRADRPGRARRCRCRQRHPDPDDAGVAATFHLVIGVRAAEDARVAR